MTFPRPELENPRFHNQRESLYTWLRESTHAAAHAAREFMNRQLALLPEWLRFRISGDLPGKWRGAFFELIVARLLQELGAGLEEPIPNSEGRLADVIADFNGQRLTIEATAIDTNPGLTSDRLRDTQLFPLFDRLLPSTWSVMLYELPAISPSDSKQGLKAILERVLPSEPPHSADDYREVREELPEGSLEFTLLPGRPEGALAVAGGPFYWIGGDDIPGRIRKAVRRKRSQVRTETNPVVLAVCLDGSPGRMEDFELALFGTRVTRVRADRSEEIAFRADGEFARAGTESPTYAGVLGFKNVDFTYQGEPVLFKHPRFRHALPAALSLLESRELADSMIVTSCPARQEVLHKVGFVERSRQVPVDHEPR